MFDNNYYKQTYGIPMESPLSPILAEIFMSDFENKLMNSNNTLVNKIIHWARYVDDVFCVLNVS